jgi:uncharacterized membrane protein
MRDRLLRDEVISFVAATLILAALVHIVAVLAAPRLAARDALARIAPAAAPNETVPIPQASPAASTFPLADPAMAAAFCRYDLASGPIRIVAPAGRSMSSISFHTRRGVVYYALTDKAAVNGAIDVVLGRPADVRALAAHDSDEAPSRDLRVVAPDPEGYVMFRVFSEFPSLYPAAEAVAQRLTCKPEPLPP